MVKNAKIIACQICCISNPLTPLVIIRVWSRKFNCVL